jgi:phospholipid-binding lipoprotein MlaA
MRVIGFFLLFFVLSPHMIESLRAQEPPVVGSEPAENEEFFEDDLTFFDEEPPLKVNDPIESVNRAIFWFNDKLYFYLFKPVARGLRYVPENVRVSADNFFDNLSAPLRFCNNLLQLQFDDASDELARFIFNSTFGVAGLFDIAKEKGGIKRRNEDFGQTLGRYGIGSGFYLVLPVFGPSNIRDAVGRLGDYYLSPLDYALKFEERIVIKVVEQENSLSLDKDTYEGIKRDALDPYLFIRDAYAQGREAAIKE